MGEVVLEDAVAQRPEQCILTVALGEVLGSKGAAKPACLQTVGLASNLEGQTHGLSPIGSLASRQQNA